MNSPAPSLLELQRAMCRSIASHEDVAARTWVAAHGVDPEARLAIYRNNFAGTLSTALHLSYPAVHRLIGDECFEGVARLFIEQHPPRCADLDHYGSEFADFLARPSPLSALAYLPDVTRVEWAVNRALHAPDAQALDVRRLVKLTQEEQARVRFTPHPSAALVRVDHPADSIWRAVLTQDDVALAAINPSDGPVWLLVYRAESGIEVSRLSERAWRFMVLLFAGHPLYAALGEAACAEAQSLLGELLAAGLFIRYGIADETSHSSSGVPS